MLSQPNAIARYAEGEIVPCHLAGGNLENHSRPPSSANRSCKIDGWRQVHMMAAPRQQALPEDGFNELPRGAVVQKIEWSRFGPVALHSDCVALPCTDLVSARL
jgi:hypothetical protein